MPVRAQFDTLMADHATGAYPVQSLKFSTVSIVGFFVAIFLIILAIRKLAYKLYCWFPSAPRVYEFQWQRKLNFYWTERADFSTVQLLRLYALWVVAPFDKYLPVIDCERQAAKTQYFHECGLYRGMVLWKYRYVNPKAWPVLLVRRLSAALLSFFFGPSNTKFSNFDKRTASNKTDDD